MPARETVLPEWAEVRASSRDEAVGVARPKRSRVQVKEYQKEK